MPRPINEQVIVITGASSGIGRETAVRAAKAGASVVLAARNEEALEAVRQEIDFGGGAAIAVPTDVGDWEQVQRLAQAAVDRFGRIDTWINNASVSEFATIEDAPVADLEQILQTNFMGVVYGVKAAIPHLKVNGGGGIINVASALAVRAVPLQGMYSATKHAVRGFSEALRMELDYGDRNISVTTINPSSINTPFFTNAKSLMPVKGKPIPPVYEPGAVAEAILHAVEHPKREVFIGAAGRIVGLMQQISPALTDRYMLFRGSMFKNQQSDKPNDGKQNLYSPPTGVGSARGEYGGITTQPVSLYTRLLGLHPNRGRIVAAIGGVIGAISLRRLATR
ncbi:MAG: SDR family oxidoreductase [Chloroflexota bacterium]|nr:SDR family oxidoreductase [Chloroflexota bacterium]